MVKLLHDTGAWKERHRVDIRERDRRGYKRPDAGKRPKTHSGATGWQHRKGLKRRVYTKCTATNNKSIKREGAFIVKKEKEEEPQSEPLIPASIRRPWHVFGEDLDDKLADAQNQGCRVETLVADRFRSVQECGARTAFTHLPEDLQQAYAEVSMLELTAYVTWRRMHEKQASSFDGPIQFDTAWDALDCDEKAEWIPEYPLTVLLSDGKWAALLVAEDSAGVWLGLIRVQLLGGHPQGLAECGIGAEVVYI